MFLSRFYSYLNSAKAILQQYGGEEPFSSFLKKYFATNKKFGSKDRKQVSHLCYCYFRMGKAGMDEPMEERILTGLFLCSEKPNDVLENLKPDWNVKAGERLEKKFSMLNAQCSMLNVIPWVEELSDGVDHEKFCESFFIQPDLFLRLRTGYEAAVKNKLKDSVIGFESVSDNCLALANASKIDEVIELNREAVVQDYSSQRVAELFSLVRPGRSDQVWDCCAASGGKSIMLHDYYPEVDLTVSDKRESIIVNLKKRFKDAGIKNYKSFVADLTASEFGLRSSDFNLIICDAPCTGSGTWSRTPEQLFYFEKEKISHYAALQKKIISNIIAHLKPGGFLLYITCSVFKKENEEVVDFIKQEFHLQLVKMELLKGYDKKADTMFAALLVKPS